MNSGLAAKPRSWLQLPQRGGTFISRVWPRKRLMAVRVHLMTAEQGNALMGGDGLLGWSP